MTRKGTRACASPPRGGTPDARVGVTSRLVLRCARRSRLTGARVDAGVPRHGRRTPRGRAATGGTTPSRFPGEKSGALVKGSGGCHRVQRRSAASSSGAPARHERARSRASARTAREGPATSRAATGAIPDGRGTRDPKRPAVGAPPDSGFGVHVVRGCPCGAGGGPAETKRVRRGTPPGGEHSHCGALVPRRSALRRRGCERRSASSRMDVSRLGIDARPRRLAALPALPARLGARLARLDAEQPKHARGAPPADRRARADAAGGRELAGLGRAPLGRRPPG